jgi:hypothetical protein
MPFHRLPSRGNPAIGLAYLPFLSPAPRSELSGTGAAGGRAPVSSQARQWSLVHGGPGWRGPRTRGLGPRVFLSKTIPRKSNFGHFALRPFDFFKINPQSMNLQSDPGIQKIILKRFLASEKSTKIALKHQNSVSFNHNSKSSDSFTKILRITSSFTLCIHLTHVCCIFLIDCLCCFVIGNVALEPFFEDFQDQAFEESQLFFMDQQGKSP